MKALLSHRGAVERWVQWIDTIEVPNAAFEPSPKRAKIEGSPASIAICIKNKTYIINGGARIR
jgi:hypothetical protein